MIEGKDGWMDGMRSVRLELDAESECGLQMQIDSDVRLRGRDEQGSA